MTLGRQAGSARAFGRAAALACLGLLACRQPVVGERYLGPVTGPGPTIEIDDAWVDLHGRVVATFTASEEDVPLALDEVEALEPRFTLAKLTDHPADGLRAWQSLSLTGKHVAPTLRPGGPDDPTVLTSVAQPGYETPASLVDLGDGRFRYVYASAVTGFDPDETLRVGAWLSGVESASTRTSSTYDFRPSGGPVEALEVVTDENCATCHGNHVAHDTIAGVRLCVTCHTWQNVDVFTVDPAALVSTTTTASTNPNPLELGRMVHRIHRGKDLPTIYETAWDGTSPTTVPSPTGLPGPFGHQGPGWPARNPLPGRKYGIVREDGHEVVFAQSLVLPTADPSFASTMLLASGGLFPRDLRDCAVCHGEAGADPDERPDVPRQGWVVSEWVSRRTCSGCHPEVWYQASSPALDRTRFPHPGGSQPDDGRCRGCHVTGGTEKLYAPIAEIHVPPARSPRYSKPTIEILRVADLAPGKQPKVTFRLSDRVGPIAPTPNAPVPAFEPDGPSSSYVPRRIPRETAAPNFTPSLTIKILGPTRPDYSLHSGVQLLSGTLGGNPDPAMLSTSAGTDEYVYTFTSTIPAGTTGTFIVGMEAKRSLTLPHYDKATDTFSWPYTGETINETAENAYVYVSSEHGTWTATGGSPGAVPRRTVVEQQKCLRCHDRIEFHGGQRHDSAWCVTCHTPDMTDLPQRLNVQKRANQGLPVIVGATFDGVEERSSHFKRNMHRIHTGARKGSASLEGIKPYALYFSKAYFFDRGGFPGDLRNCTLCHAAKSYLVESVPADAAPSRGNEQATIWHPQGSAAHPDDEPSVLPVTAACTGCHATGATFSHVAAKTVGGVEACGQCHSKGPYSVEVAHGLAPPSGGGAGSSFSSILEEVLVPRCATSACHVTGVTPPVLDAAGAYDALVGVQSGQASLKLVEPNAPEQSYLVHKLRGTATSVGGSVAAIMPPDGALAPADLAAIEAWIANGAPND